MKDSIESDIYSREITIAKHILENAADIGWVKRPFYDELKRQHLIYEPQNNDYHFEFKVSYKADGKTVKSYGISVTGQNLNSFIQHDFKRLQKKLNLNIENKVSGFVPLPNIKKYPPDQEEIRLIRRILGNAKDLPWENVSSEYGPDWGLAYRYDQITVCFRISKDKKKIADYELRFGTHVYKHPSFMSSRQTCFDILQAIDNQQPPTSSKDVGSKAINNSYPPQKKSLYSENEKSLKRILSKPEDYLWTFWERSYAFYFKCHPAKDSSVTVCINHVNEKDSTVTFNGYAYNTSTFSPAKLEKKLLALLPKETHNNKHETKPSVHASQEQQRSPASPVIFNVRDFVIKCHTFKCTKASHEIENIKASIPVILKNGDEKIITVTAGYCIQCGTYFIMESTYMNLKQHGIISCRVYDEKTYQKYVNVNGMLLAEESLLKQYGYNVSEQEGLSERQRRKVLANLIDNHILSKTEVISHLDFCISMHQNEKFVRSVSKWESDREFVENYWPGEMKKYGANAIYRH